MKIIYLFSLLCLATNFTNAQTKLQIVKGLKVQIEYKQGYFIDVITKNGIANQGVIYLVTDDSLYLDNYINNIALQDIVTVLPIFKAKFNTFKPRDLGEWLMSIFASAISLTNFDYTGLRQMWLPNTFDNPNFTSYQKRMRKKAFDIGGKYKLQVK